MLEYTRSTRRLINLIVEIHGQAGSTSAAHCVRSLAKELAISGDKCEQFDGVISFPVARWINHCHRWTSHIRPRLKSKRRFFKNFSEVYFCVAVIIIRIISQNERINVKTGLYIDNTCIFNWEAQLLKSFLVDVIKGRQKNLIMHSRCKKTNRLHRS